MKLSEPSARGRRLRPAAAILGVLLLLAALEVTARALFPVPPVLNFHRLAYARAKAADEHPGALAHRLLWWWSEPDGAWFRYRTNLHGFRDRAWRLRKRPGTTRLAFVGDSFVEGLGAPDGRTITDCFGRLARERGLDAEVMNLGAGGFAIPQYARLIRDTVQLFRPDDLVLVLYMNDVYDLPEIDPLLEGAFEAERPRWWVPRLLHVAGEMRRGRRVPVRWHLPHRGQPYRGGPQPLAVERWFAADPGLAKRVARNARPDLAAAMMAGRLNPAVIDLLDRSSRILPQPVDLTGQIGALARFAARHSVRLWVVYLPSLNQVSDAYLPAQRSLSRPIAAESLTGPSYQRHARDLARACAAAGVPYLDLTPALADAESAGRRLYWPYDGHMTADGYDEVGRRVFGWWWREPEARSGADARATPAPG